MRMIGSRFGRAAPHRLRAWLTTIGGCSLLLVALPARATAQLPAELASRLSAIFATNEYDARWFDARWLEDGSGYTVLEASPSVDGMDLLRNDTGSVHRDVLVVPSQLVPSGEAQPLRLEGQNHALSPDASLLLVRIMVGTNDRGDALYDYWLLDRRSGALRRLRSNVESWFRGFAPGGDRVLFNHRNNLEVQDLRSGQITPLTQDGEVGAVGNGVSDWPSRWQAAHWSPDGRWIAYLQVDSRDVGEFPIIDFTEATYPRARYRRYAKVGSPIPRVRVGVVSASGGATRWMAIPEDSAGQWIDAVEWRGGSDELVIQKVSRARDARHVFLADAATGAVTPFLHERDDAWVADIFSWDAGLHWIAGGRSFVWLRERDGWRRAYVVSRDLATRTALTPAGVDVIGSVTVDERSGYLYYAASPDDATQRYLFRVSLDGRDGPERVTPADQPGTHRYQFSPDGRWAFHAYSTFDSPPVVSVVQLPEHRAIRVLEDNEELRARMSDWSPRPVEFLELDMGDGLRFDAWLLAPRDFDPGRKYPVLVYVYAEPGLQTVVDDWWGYTDALFHRAIADAGYLVVSIDTRGTPAPKGSAWRRAVFPSLGPLSTEEQAAALRELARTRPYIDLTRVGIWGSSAGGTNTLNALFREPDLYHVGIAVATKPVPELYGAAFQEIYMRTPQENPEGYRAAAPIHYAEGLRGRLLIVHGSGETNAHLQGVEHLVNRLIELGKPFDYMVYPNRNHGLREGPGTKLHVYSLIARYLIEHLPAGPREVAW
jgi:dipeptidyl-peptidase 4